ncbi:MAG: ATP-binding cassette domain-containing protein [Candidatus Competibacteraceae bacterium]|nr:ATP-binding cassette domain-containing protein [Candidatus Competibacteraceae bacterium]
MLTLRQLSLQRGGKPLLEDVSLQVYPGQKVGVVGANGSGKSTLFALLQDQVQQDSGDLNLPAGWRIAQVAQETPALRIAAIDFVLDGDSELRRVEAELHAAEAGNDGVQLAELHARLDALDGYSAQARAAKLLAGLGFTATQLEQAVAEFSGGWRERLNLARALMARSDLLLLDEPTNHLDLDAVLWLEQWLRSYSGTLLLISHDRDFLDNVVDNIAHLENRQIRLYSGNYSAFEAQRAARLALQQATYTKQQREIAHLQGFVDRFRAKATKAKQAQSRLKALERMEKIAPAHVDSPFQFGFKPPEKLPHPLLSIEQAAAGYADRNIFQQATLTISPGTRLGLLGPNGAGKSTLIKLLAGMLPLAAGQRQEGQGLVIGYFAQHQLEQLRPDWTPLQHLQKQDSQVSDQVARDFLGGFGFRGDQATALVEPFSGGEKARLVLALLVWQRPNLLLLDEPTNHLDLEMRLALTLALQEYLGALMVVSHDRHLLRTTTDEFILVAAGQITPFSGDLDDYRDWLNQRPDQDFDKSPPKDTATRQEQKRQAAQRRQQLSAKRRPLEQQLRALEKQIERLSVDKTTIEASLADPHIYDDAHKVKLKELLLRQGRNEQELEKLEEDWLNLQEALEAMAD